jgi:hypothetical protein
MVPDSYKIAFAALDAVWQQYPSESLAILLGGMAINRHDEIPMDAGFGDDWRQIARQTNTESTLELIQAFLDLDASRYRYGDVPDDLRCLIDALRNEGSPERIIVDSVIATWHADPESWPLYAELTRET